MPSAFSQKSRGAGFALLFASAVVVVLSTASTTSARFSAQTSNESNLFEAAIIDLTVESERQLFLDGTGLYPGLELQNCIVVTYEGSIDEVDIRLFAQRTSGTLDGFFDLELDLGTGQATDCSDFVTSERVFEGTLAEFERDHATFDRGVVLAEDQDSGVQVTVRARGQLQDTNDAQGVEGRFVTFVEARQ